VVAELYEELLGVGKKHELLKELVA